MKFNWGTGITLAIIAFMAFILFMVFKATMTNADLEAPDYYDQEIKYQNRIDAITNTKNLIDELRIEQTDNSIIFTFPSDIVDEMSSGNIYFFKPDNAEYDRRFEISMNNGAQEISKEQFVVGKYRIKVDWKANEKAYFSENLITIRTE
nr:hypothetical protein [uncultured bacterium]